MPTSRLRLPEAVAAACLETIEADIQGAPNRVKAAMLLALIGIGCRALNERAWALAGRVGPVTVDDGETSRKTPDPIALLSQERLQAKLATADRTR